MFALSGVVKLSLVGLLTALSAIVISTIWGLYLDSFFHSVSLVGYFSSAMALISFISFFLFVPIIEKIDKGKIFSYSLLVLGIIYLLFAFNTGLSFLIILAIAATIFGTLRITSFGIIFKDISSREELSRNQGLKYTFANTAAVLGPLMVAYLLVKFGFSSVFALSSAFAFIAFIAFKKSHIGDRYVTKRIDKNVIRNFLDFFSNKERRLIYVLRGGVALWWELIYLFVPLFIIRSGLGQAWVGYFLFGAAVPLVLFNYYFAKIAGRKGFRKIFRIGFLIPLIVSFIAFFLHFNVYIVLALFILGSLGMAMLEPTTEAYFFDILEGEEEYRFFGPFNTNPVSIGFIGKIIAASLLLFLPFRYLFLLYSGYMLIMFLLSFKVKDVVETKKKRR